MILPPPATPSDETDRRGRPAALPALRAGLIVRLTMAKRIQFRRLVLMAVVLSLAFGGLGYRLVDLQVLRHEEFSAKALRNTLHNFVFEPRRGDILDAKGNILATTEQAKTVCADPASSGTFKPKSPAPLRPFCRRTKPAFARGSRPARTAIKTAKPLPTSSSNSNTRSKRRPGRKSSRRWPVLALA